ncbi:MAG: FHA domain-containing protein [Clostridiales bacterium]|nr:FHA domain-containing protein [Clostridiales bacterium]
MSGGFLKKLFFNEDEQVKIKKPGGKQRSKAVPTIELDIKSNHSEYRVEVRTFPCVIGRNKQAHVFLEDVSVSRPHASIDLIDGAFIIIDHNSENGVIVSGAAVPSGHSRRIYEGDTIKMGRSELFINKIIIPN